MATQLQEAWDQEDDWRGLTSPAERRRRQNRLNQRIYRNKRLLKSLALNNDNSAKSANTATGLELSWPVDEAMNLPMLVVLRKAPELSRQILEFMKAAYAHWSLNNPSPHHLPTLARLNAFDALIRNAIVLQIPVECLETDEGPSPFTVLGPPASSLDLALPEHLSPVPAQHDVPHHPWLDLFPFPGMRDNILRGIEAGRYDEDSLCEELCCELLNLDAASEAAIMIWGDSWDARGWEFSPAFFAKYGMLLQESDGMLEASNHWRQSRGEMKIESILN